MFVESLVESTPLLRSRNRLPALMSIGAQAALVAMVMAIPLLHPEVLPMAVNRMTTLAPPPLPVAPPPTVVDRPHVVPATTSVTLAIPAAPTPMLQALRAVAISDGPPVDSPALAIGTAGTVNAALPAALIASTPPARVVGAESSKPMRISEGVTAGMLLAAIQPVYPQMARLTHTSGVVVVEAVISKAGKVESAHAVSGPAMLQSAAVDSVRAARYRPFLLNQEPTEVETTFTINFRMQ
jgi:protein TonB